MHAIMHHPNKDALIACLQSKRSYTPLSEQEKQKIHTITNVKCFELCKISPNIQCPLCLKNWTEGIVYCDCGACSVPTELTRNLKRERFDALTIPNFVIKKGGSHGARHCKVPSSKSLFEKTEQKRFHTNNLQRFPGCETHRRTSSTRNKDGDEPAGYADQARTLLPTFLSSRWRCAPRRWAWGQTLAMRCQAKFARTTHQYQQSLTGDFMFWTTADRFHDTATPTPASDHSLSLHDT